MPDATNVAACRITPAHAEHNSREAVHPSQLQELAKALKSRASKRPLWYAPRIESIQADLHSPRIVRGKGRIVWIEDPELAYPHGAFAAVWDTAPSQLAPFLPRLRPLPGEYMFVGLAASGVVIALAPLETNEVYLARYLDELDRRQKRSPEERRLNATGVISERQKASGSFKITYLLLNTPVGVLSIFAPILGVILFAALAISFFQPKGAVHSPLGVGLLGTACFATSLICWLYLLWKARAAQKEAPCRAEITAKPIWSGGYRRGSRWLLPINGRNYEIPREVWEYLVEDRRYEVFYRNSGDILVISLPTASAEAPTAQRND